MDGTVRSFIESNNNDFINWRIDGVFIGVNEVFPNDLMNRHICSWKINNNERSVEIITYQSEDK